MYKQDLLPQVEVSQKNIFKNLWKWAYNCKQSSQKQCTIRTPHEQIIYLKNDICYVLLRALKVFQMLFHSTYVTKNCAECLWNVF